MDLILTDKNLFDIGIPTVKGDFSFGIDENDFELTYKQGETLPKAGSVFYCEGTDIGGVVRGYKLTDKTIKVTGDTWSGILDTRAITPPKGEDYLTVSGELNNIVSGLIHAAGLDHIIKVSKENSTIKIGHHTFKAAKQDATQGDTGRYMSVWSAIWQLCMIHHAKPLARWQGNPAHVLLNFAPRVDHTQNEELSTSVYKMQVKSKRPTNHLICLGKGELKNREVLHLYADENGNISTTQTLTGIDEIAEIYDYSSSNNLRTDGEKKLKKLQKAAQEIKVDIPDGYKQIFDLGDLIGGVDLETGVSAKAVITKKVVTFPEGVQRYETSEAYKPTEQAAALSTEANSADIAAAKTTAQAADKKADEAKTEAKKTQATAIQAQTRADQAYQKAEGAYLRAQDAKSRADDAYRLATSTTTPYERTYSENGERLHVKRYGKVVAGTIDGWTAQLPNARSTHTIATLPDDMRPAFPIEVAIVGKHSYAEIAAEIKPTGEIIVWSLGSGTLGTQQIYGNFSFITQ